MMPRMSITDTGWYGTPQPDLPPVRVFTRPDTRLMFEDMFAKFAAHNNARDQPQRSEHD